MTYFVRLLQMLQVKAPLYEGYSSEMGLNAFYGGISIPCGLAP